MEEFRTEANYQWFYIKHLFYNRKKLYSPDFRLRSAFVFFFNIQTVYLLLNFYFHPYFFEAVKTVVHSNESLVVYYPTIELYIGNKIFYFCMLIFFHYVFLGSLIAVLSALKSKTDYKNTFRENLIGLGFLPLTVLLPIYSFPVFLILTNTIDYYLKNEMKERSFILSTVFLLIHLLGWIYL